jgi:glyoxylase I family protein
MEKVTGIGGLFFRAQDPAALGRWYQEHLGVSLTPSSYEDLPWRQEAGPTAFSPFPEATDYFGDSKQVWMVNFRVRDLDAMAAQLQAAGIGIDVDPQHYPNGRFARLHDPEDNPIELWQPGGETLRVRLPLKRNSQVVAHIAQQLLEHKVLPHARSAGVRRQSHFSNTA